MTDQAKRLHTARTRTVGDRDKGTSRSSDGRLDIKLSAPGGPGIGANPEQLLAAAWSASLQSAIALEAQRMKIVLPTRPTIDAEVDLNLEGDSHFLSARFDVDLPGLDRFIAESLIRRAEATCPYCKAMRGTVDVTIAVAPALRR